jgi:hypothetical protein
MIRKRKMNTIVNITGLTLRCLEAGDGNVIKRKTKGYYKNLITVSCKKNPKEYKKQWYLNNKEHKKQYDIKYRKEIYNKIRRERIKNDPEYRKKINEARKEYGKRPEQKIKRNKYLKNKLKIDHNYKLIIKSPITCIIFYYITIIRVMVFYVYYGHYIKLCNNGNNCNKSHNSVIIAYNSK